MSAVNLCLCLFPKSSSVYRFFQTHHEKSSHKSSEPVLYTNCSQVTLQPHEVPDLPLHQEPLPSVNLLLKEGLSCFALNQETPQSLSYQQQLHQHQFIIRF